MRLITEDVYAVRVALEMQTLKPPSVGEEFVEKVAAWTEIFRFVELPEVALARAFDDAKAALFSQRHMNAGDVVSAWLATLPESENGNGNF